MKIIVNIAGGFGNQLFSYAFGYALSQEKNAKLCLDTSTQDSGMTRKLDLINLNVAYDCRMTHKYGTSYMDKVFLNKIRKLNAIGWTNQFYIEKNPTVYEPSVHDINTSTYFKGNWQSEKYFKDYREELCRMFTPVKPFSPHAQAMIDEVAQGNSVAIHIRRGDYMDLGNTISMDYYERAINSIRPMLEKPVFYIFSDDRDYCKAYFESHFKDLNFKYPVYPSENTTLDDFFLMTACKHQIIANSSYSWWAAWLNSNPEKRIIAPEVNMWSGDFYPDEWLKIKSAFM